MLELRTLRLIAGLVCALWLTGATDAAAQMVRYVDERGTVHVAGSLGEVPLRYRDVAVVVGADRGEGSGRLIQSPTGESRRGASGQVRGSQTQRWQASPSTPGQALAPGQPGAKRIIPEFTGWGLFAYLGTNFFVSVLVLAGCCVLIGERVEHLGINSVIAAFLQRGAMLAAFAIFLSATMYSQWETIGDLATLLLKPLATELVLTAVIARIFLAGTFGRALVLGGLFCVLDSAAQGVLLISCFALLG